MEFLAGVCSDIGISKKVNQDAAMIRKAETKKGTVMFAVVCDGMGGLEKGELASSTVIKGMSEWFESIFPDLLYHNFTADAIKNSWKDVLSNLNHKICSYGKERNIYLGTTITALLLIEDAYYICNVGDSRTYCMDSKLRLITRDQSFVQQEIDMGRMSQEEAENSSQRNVLLQCVGVGETVAPDFYIGEYNRGTDFLLCSDGFHHVITEEEIWNEFRSGELNDTADIEQRIQNLIEVVKERQEVDNITALFVHAM